MASPDPEQVMQQHLQLSKELREIEDEFNRREQHELAALEQARREIDAQWQKEHQTLISQLPTQTPLTESLEKVFTDKRDALLALKEQTYEREKAERQRRFEDDKRKHTYKWRSLLSLSSTPGPLNLSEVAQSLPSASDAGKSSFGVPDTGPRQPELPSRQFESFPRGIQGSQQAAQPLEKPVVRSHVPTASHESVGLQPSVPNPNSSFQPQSVPNHSSNSAPYQPPNQAYHVPRPPNQFSNAYSHSHPHPSHGPPLPLPTPPTLPSQPLPHSAQRRKPLPSGPSQPPSRPPQQPVGLYQPPPRHFPTERDPHQFPPRTTLFNGAPGGAPPAAPVLSQGPAVGQLPDRQPVDGPAPGGPPGLAVEGPNRQERVGPSDARVLINGVPVVVEQPPQFLNRPVTDAQLQKRRADEPPASTELQSKRARVEGAENADAEEKSQSPGRSKNASPKTISFAEVFGGGNAKHKHFIVEYPPHGGKFYILKCDQHGVHFNANPLAGAAKHLHSAQHGNMSKERAQAVDLLGYLVHDCTAELANMNNDLFKKALDDGSYRIFNMNQLSKSMRRSMGYPDDPETGPPKAANDSSLAPLLPRNSRSSTQFRGITNPEAGELYLAYWKKDKKHYAVMILPWGSLERAGMNGSLSSTGLLQKAPACYIVDPITQQISGWNPEVPETKREFPVLYFDGRMSVGWVRAKDLSPFYFDDRNLGEIPHYKDAQDHYARCRRFADYQAMVESRNEASRAESQGQVGVTTIARAPATPAEDHDNMLNNATAQAADDSDVDSTSKGMTDLDSDVEMANTESRRTSVSNRGDLQDQNDKAVSADPEAFQASEQEPANRAVVQGESMGYVPSSGLAMSLAQTAQLVMARTSPPATIEVAPSEARTGRPKGPSEQGSRRVEKIYAHSNPNRSSRSPRVNAVALPDRRVENAGQQNGTPSQAPRVPSPASLQNILQNRSAGNDAPRPVSPRQQGYLAEPARGPSPLQHPLASAEPAAPAPRPLATVLSNAKARIPSPLQMPSRQVSQQAAQVTAEHRLPGSTPISGPISGSGFVPRSDSRGSTPVMVRIESSAAQDLRRLVRPELSSTSGSEPPRNPQQIVNPLPTPNPSSAGTQPGSPGIYVKQSTTISVRTTPTMSVKRESPGLGGGTGTKETFDVGLLTDPENPECMEVKETVRLMVDPDNKAARTVAGSGVKLVVEPSKLTTMRVEGPVSARIVKLVFSDGRVQRLVFEPSIVGLGVQQNGFIHARRFCRWVTSVAPSVDYINVPAESLNQRNEPRRTESVIHVE